MTPMKEPSFIEIETVKAIEHAKYLKRVTSKSDAEWCAVYLYDAFCAKCVEVEELGKAVEWVNVKDRLPDIDEYVLWRHESGAVFMDCIDKDMDEGYIKYFLSGNGQKEIAGPINHWMKIPALEGEE